jgi:hypothetical protein
VAVKRAGRKDKTAKRRRSGSARRWTVLTELSLLGLKIHDFLG